MKNSHQQTDDTIFRYLDGQLTMQEKEQFEAALKRDERLQQRFTELKLVSDTLKTAQLEIPSINFTANVMNNLGRMASPVMLSPKNGLMLLLGVGVAMMLGVIALASGWFDQLTGAIALEQFNLPKTVIKQSLPTIPINGGMVMKVLIGLNLVIVFVLLDKTILQPYFKNRTRRA